METKMKTELKTITPEIAREMLKRNSGNRQLANSHVTYLSEQMKEGAWKQNGASIVLTADGRLLDGQHRLNAIIQSDTSQKMIVISGVHSDAFDTMDTGKTRSSGDVLSIKGVEYHNIVSAAIKMIIDFENGHYAQAGNRTKCTNTRVLNFIEEHPEVEDAAKKANLWYTKFQRVYPHSKMAAFFYMMSKKNVTDAEEFWEKLSTGVGLQEGSPILTLRNKLLQIKMSKLSVNNREKSMMIIKAWNSYRKRENLHRLIILQDEEFPEMI